MVPPLEGLWWIDEGAFSFEERDNWKWTLMIRQPEFANEEVVRWAANELARKKPELAIEKARFESLEEGLCVQIMHIGSFDDEPATVAIMDEYLEQHGYVIDISATRMHHEIYLSDPRKGEPTKCKTVIRHPIKKN